MHDSLGKDNDNDIMLSLMSQTYFLNFVCPRLDYPITPVKGSHYMRPYPVEKVQTSRPRIRLREQTIFALFAVNILQSYTGFFCDMLWSPVVISAWYF